MQYFPFATAYSDVAPLVVLVAIVTAEELHPSGLVNRDFVHRTDADAGSPPNCPRGGFISFEGR